MASSWSRLRFSSPSRPKRLNTPRRWKSSATWITAFDGMQPTRAQVVPSSPPLMSTTDFPAGRTRLMAYKPALPDPIIATSTCRSCMDLRTSGHGGKRRRLYRSPRYLAGSACTVNAALWCCRLGLDQLTGRQAPVGALGRAGGREVCGAGPEDGCMIGGSG
jgi:hypothetical protein